jgi:hypothetical protein
MPYLDSEALDWVDYDERTRILRAIFKENERAYRYKSVPKELYNQLLEAESIGTFFNFLIKPYFPCEEIKRSDIRLPPRSKAPRRRRPSKRPSIQSASREARGWQM